MGYKPWNSSLERKTPLKQGKPLERNTPLKSRGRTGKERTNWERLKQQCFERDNYRCQWPRCNQRATDVHHRRFKSQGGKDVLRNLISLCRYHHRYAHDNPEEAWRAEIVISDKLDAIYGETRF